MKRNLSEDIQWIKQTFQLATCCSLLDSDKDIVSRIFHIAKASVQAEGYLFHYRAGKNQPFNLLFHDGLEKPELNDISNSILETCSHQTKPHLEYKNNIHLKYIISFLFQHKHYLQGILSFVRPFSDKMFDNVDHCRGEILASAATAILQVHQYSREIQTQFKKSNALLNRFYIIYEISNALLKTRELDVQLLIILTAATLGEGLGFNRALLFLRDDTHRILQGKMAVGPDNETEAKKIWEHISQNPISIKTWFQDILQRKKRPTDTLNEKVSSITIDIIEDNGILARTIRENNAFIHRTTDPDSRLSEIDKQLFPNGEFASVPLLVENESIGLIAVDKCFSHQKISREDVQFLWMIANLAASAIDNSKTYNRLVRLNMELKKTRAALITAEKSSAVGEMALELAHEIRNPLVAVGGFARKLINMLKDGSIEKKYSEIIYEEAEKLEEILKNVLETAKMPEPSLKNHDLNKIVSDTLEVLKFNIEEHNISLELKLCPLHPVVLVDSSYLKQALHNLIQNAIQAQTQGGLIRIETDLENNMAILRIFDSGPGIEEKLLEEIFSPFFTTKSQGTGLGLYLAQKMLQKCQAKIIPALNKDGGMCFTIRFFNTSRNKDIMKGVLNEDDFGNR